MRKIDLTLQQYQCIKDIINTYDLKVRIEVDSRNDIGEISIFINENDIDKLYNRITDALTDDPKSYYTEDENNKVITSERWNLYEDLITLFMPIDE